MTRFFLIFFIAATMISVGGAQSLDTDKLDQYFDTLDKYDKWMGSVGISRDGEIIYRRAIGMADIEGEVSATPASIYRIGSISKTFTTVLVMMAVDEGALSLDQPLSEYYPDIEHADQIQISDLLYHRSGIHNITSDADYQEYYTEPKSRDELLALIVEKGSDFTPGEKAEYSNSNFLLLTFILEEVFQLSYDQLVERMITAQIGLKDTYVGGPIDVTAGEVKSYKRLGDWTLEAETDMSIPLGAGAVVSTPSDLVRFADALFGAELIDQPYVDMMKELKDDYGMGLFKFPFHDKWAYGHNGGIDGFRSNFAHFEDEGVSFAMISNGSNYNDNDIALAVLSAIFDQPYEIPVFSDYKVEASALHQYVGYYTSEQMPLDIEITREGNVLIAQATGQGPLSLEAASEHVFTFAPAGVELTFDPTIGQMILKQNGATFYFDKQEK